MRNLSLSSVFQHIEANRVLAESNVQAGANPLRQQRRQSQNPEEGDGFERNFNKPWSYVSRALGLPDVNVETTLSKLSGAQMMELQGLARQFQTLSPERFQGAFVDFIKRYKLQNSKDLNATVQYVMRETYNSNSEDLHFYATKVKFFNRVKAAIREELQRGRTALAHSSGILSDSPDLVEPYVPRTIGMDFTGGLDVVVTEAETSETSGRSADAAFQTGTFNDSGWEFVSGNRWDPLAIDLDGDGAVSTMAAGENGVFDLESWEETRTRTGSGAGPANAGNMTGSGGAWRVNERATMTRRFTEWFAPTEGIVVFDRNGNGKIEGQDLFGDQNVTGRNASNGFDDLASLDSNNDGFFDFKDEKFHKLRIWQDRNSDGKAGPDEMTTLFQNGITRLSLSALSGALNGEDGNIITEGSTFTRLHGAFLTKDQLTNHVEKLEQQLMTVGDDAQLANVDLQNMLQRQQQTLQTMSNMSKVLHDTAMSVIKHMT